MRSSTRQLDSLTGLRWVAALMVLVTHAAFQPGLLPYSGTTEDIKAVVKMGGYIGVGFFFVLSGFVLTWSMRPDDTPRKFWRRRFFKIYPNHFVTFVLAVVMMVIHDRELVGIVPNLLLVQAWSTDLDVAFGINDVSWSLSAEMLFYRTAGPRCSSAPPARPPARPTNRPTDTDGAEMLADSSHAARMSRSDLGESMHRRAMRDRAPSEGRVCPESTGWKGETEGVPGLGHERDRALRRPCALVRTGGARTGGLGACWVPEVGLGSVRVSDGFGLGSIGLAVWGAGRRSCGGCRRWCGRGR
ncbi:acyltransferase [Frankia sp. EAN1pec]|uniref:acyltransferase family protein n=1 Tax=Parafrankia sp. (strain EAN1pec) TaxID=298653 RepID=UPI00059D4635